jgi:hypothetical protein
MSPTSSPSARYFAQFPPEVSIHSVLVADSEQENVAGPMNFTDRLSDAIPAVAEMIGARCHAEFRMGVTACALGVLGDVLDRRG